MTPDVPPPSGTQASGGGVLGPPGRLGPPPAPLGRPWTAGTPPSPRARSEPPLDPSPWGPILAMAAETLNFGPEWLRALSGGGGVASPPPSPALPRYRLAENRYGREEMLALYVPGDKAPREIREREFAAIAQEQPLPPLALLPLTQEEQCGRSAPDGPRRGGAAPRSPPGTRRYAQPRAGPCRGGVLPAGAGGARELRPRPRGAEEPELGGEGGAAPREAPAA